MPARAPGEIPRLARENAGDELVVDVPERLDEALGVARRKTRRARGGRREITHVGRAALVDALGADRILHVQVVRRLLVPEERGLVPVHAQAQSVLLARGDLRGDERGLRPVLETQEDGRIVVEPAAREGRAVREQHLHLASRHVLDQREGVDADVRQHAARARDLRIHLPAVAAVGLAEAPLLVFDDDLVDRTEIPVTHEVTRELDHRIARVGERNPEEASLALRDAAERLGLLHREGQRLLAEDVEARLEGGLRDRVMRLVRRADDEEVDAIRLCGKERLPVGVDARGVEPELRARTGVRLRVAREAAGHEVGVIAHPHGHSVDRTDERAPSPAHHRIFKSSRFGCHFVTSHLHILPLNASMRSHRRL